MKKFNLLFATLCLWSVASFGQGGDNLDRLADRATSLWNQLEKELGIAAKDLGREAEILARDIEHQWNEEWSVKEVRVNGKALTPFCPETAFLGIESIELSFEKAEKLGFENKYGSYVSKVMAKSAGESAGLQAFDYIYGVDDQHTTEDQNLSDILESYEPGSTVKLHLIRKGKQMSLEVRLDGTTDFYEEAYDENRRPFLGVSSIDEDGEALNGVSVEVVEKSTAEEMGLQEGDVITFINGFPMLDWDDVVTSIQSTRPGDDIEVTFERNGEVKKAQGKIKSYVEVFPEGKESGWNLNIDWDEVPIATIGMEDTGELEWEQWEPEQDDDRAFMGIYTEMISAEKARKLGFDNLYGTYVTGIIPNTGADRAGLRPFDYIFGFDDNRPSAEKSLGDILKKYKPGEKATVHFVRSGKKASAPITFGKASQAKKLERNSCQDPFFGIMPSGEESDGVRILGPVPNSTAKEAGLQEGDFIQRVNGHRILDWMDITTAIEMLNPGETITVEFDRDGKSMKASKPIKSYAQTKDCKDCDCGMNDVVVLRPAAVPPARLEVADAKVAIGNVGTDEVGKMQGRGVSLTTANSLSVQNLQVTPEPSTGLFRLEFDLPTSGNTAVKVYNLNGRLLYEYDLGNFSGKFSDSVDIAQNGPGNYYLQVTQAGKVFSKKINLSKS